MRERERESVCVCVCEGGRYGNHDVNVDWRKECLCLQLIYIKDYRVIINKNAWYRRFVGVIRATLIEFSTYCQCKNAQGRVTQSSDASYMRKGWRLRSKILLVIIDFDS